MTQEENAKAYTELINRLEDVKDAIKKQNYGIAMDILYKPYPEFQITTSTELKESEDERIRKALICHISKISTEIPVGALHRINGVDILDILAWLENQKVLTTEENLQGKEDVLWCIKQAMKHAKDENEMGTCWFAEKWVEKQGEQNFVDKVEPKFKVGDWIAYNHNPNLPPRKIIQITNEHYVFNNGSFEIKTLEADWHLWTIQDAKDGDILVDNLGNICIYQEPSTKLMYHSYCYGNHKRFIDMGGSHEIAGSYPATKEQRDTLEKAMTDAGYTFDFEKKELKKIEQKPVDVRTTGYWHVEDINQKHTLSEEDEKTLNSIITNYESGYLPSFDKRDEIVKKLKSLKDRYTWKPTEEQMYNLSEAAHYNCAFFDMEILKGLYDDLKKLREE